LLQSLLTNTTEYASGRQGTEIAYLSSMPAISN
jgi:hypothetical protein